MGLTIAATKAAITWWQAIILGIVQGLAEFLPISSSGHLDIAETIMDLELPRFFDVMLHVGTLLAVFIVFRKDLISILRKPKQKLTWMILLATVPTLALALLLEMLDISGAVLGYGFMITGILLYSMEMYPRSRSTKTLKEMTWKEAVIIGCIQGVATLPGISRSGSTISGGVFTGLDRKFLARFSFLLSIPAILAAFCFDLLKMILEFKDGTAVLVAPLPMILGMITSFFVGYAAIRWMLKLIAEKSFKPFAVYTLILGFLVCLDKFALHIFF